MTLSLLSLQKTPRPEKILTRVLPEGVYRTQCFGVKPRRHGAVRHRRTHCLVSDYQHRGGTPKVLPAVPCMANENGALLLVPRVL